MELADRIELHELPGRYGDLIDDRDWDGLDQIFLEHATFEIPGFTMEGLPGIRAFMADKARNHPRTHMMTNIYVDDTPDGVILRFRLVGMLNDGRIRSVRYRDVVVKDASGWRVAGRVVTETPYQEPVSS